jgi:DNA-binding transcriptional regulator YiaG
VLSHLRDRLAPARVAGMDTQKQPQTAAPLALRAWMMAHSVSFPALATLASVKRQTVYRWVDGSSRPSALARQVIERVTGGHVPASLWMTAEEMRRLVG